MKRLLIAAAIAATTVGAVTIAVPAMADSFSLSVGQPGFYGRINVGGYPPPEVVYAQPVMVEQDAPMDQPPIYLRVPPQQSSHWGHYCRMYNACGERVMFVQDDWYRNQYAPHYRHDHHHGWGHNGGDWNHNGGDHQDHHNGDNGGNGGGPGPQQWHPQ